MPTICIETANKTGRAITQIGRPPKGIFPQKLVFFMFVLTITVVDRNRDLAAMQGTCKEAVPLLNKGISVLLEIS